MLDNELSKRANEVATEVLFLRSASAKAAVIVEGASDARFLSRFLCLSQCEIVVAENKANALEVGDILGAKQFDGFVVIVDRDYDHICDELHENDNILYVDDNDLDVMVFRLSALHTLLIECGSKHKIDAVGGWESVRDLVAKEARKLGVVRLISRLEDRNLKFSGLTHDFVCRRTLTSKQIEVVRRVLGHSRLSQAGAEKVSEVAEKLIEQHQDFWLLCQGHDLASYLGRGLQSFLGSRSSTDAASEVISRLLRLSYDSADFNRSEIREKLIAWQNRNAPFGLLKEAA